ncbi:hypothetical protein ACOMHN_034123 [Nucella lapillus]
MPKIALQLKASMENVTNLKPDGEDFLWFMKLKCNNCGEETPDFITCSLTDFSPLSGGRGHASVVIKCKLCKRENSIDILKDSLAAYEIDDASCQKFKTIVKFDCRGVSPEEFSPRAGWIAEGVESNTPFEIDLTQREWYDYDEKAGEQVSVNEVEFQFVTCKH